MNLILFENNELYNTDNTGSILRRDERAVHLLKVLHKKTGSSFDAGILDGKLGTGTIIDVTDKELCFGFVPNSEPPPRTPLRLGVGFPRPIQLRRLLRDCASLGLAAVDLIGTELGEKSYRDTKLLSDGGARSSLIEGAVQSRDTRLPELAVYPNLNDWLQMVITDNAILLAADNVRPKESFSGVTQIKPGIPVVLAVGPERGWSDGEREQLEQAGFIRLSFGIFDRGNLPFILMVFSLKDQFPLDSSDISSPSCSALTVMIHVLEYINTILKL